MQFSVNMPEVLQLSNTQNGKATLVISVKSSLVTRVSEYQTISGINDRFKTKLLNTCSCANTRVISGAAST